MSQERQFIPVNIAVLTVSDMRPGETDTSGSYGVVRLPPDEILL